MNEDDIIKIVCSVEKENKDKYEVKFESLEIIFLNEETIYLNNIKPGLNISLKDLENIINDDDYIVCKNYAFNLVSRFSKTRKELEDKLISKGHNALNIKKVIDLLKGYNLINDESYAKNYIMSKLQKEGKEKISYELSVKGVSKDVIESSFEKINDENESVFTNSLMKIGKKKYLELISKEDDVYKVKEKLYSYLARKGFKWDEIKACVNSILDEVKD